MNYSVIKRCDIADGPGVRVSIFVSGCRNHCKGCFQPETWDFKYGQEFDNDAKQEIMEQLDKSFIQGLSVLGGDPMEPENIDTVFKICLAAKQKHKDVWVYSGYCFEYLMHRYPHHRIWDNIDVLVDGPFIKEQKNLGLRFRGSENQRLIDVRKSINSGKIIIWIDPTKQDKRGMMKTNQSNKGDS